MIELTCPACGRVFPVLPVPSEGWCACGTDYEIDAAGVVTWKVDGEGSR